MTPTRHDTHSAEKPQRRNTALPANPDRALQAMMSTIDDLRRIYVQETEALQTTDTAAFLALQEPKLDAARRYQSEIEQILRRKDEMKRADPTLKQRLEEMQSSFTKLAAENRTALERMQRCTARLNEKIREAARDSAQRQRAYSYGACGKIRDSGNKAVSAGLSETA